MKQIDEEKQLIEELGLREALPCRLRVCLRDYVGITTSVPQTAADLLLGPNRQGRTTSRHARMI
jgi:hypothetical protein